MLRPDPFISVVIPAYNEARRIGETLKKIISYLSRQDYSYEIIVVDDASSDQTAKIIENFGEKIILLKNRERRGKGYSIRQGILSAGGSFILFSDADLSTPIEELEKLLFW
ncbi:MAG: glycosyltransferase, partial [Candidatus Omnitrophica bacterium]|nr:glycosyltransferase [Candidatus Omnitrophota bacterium]